MIGQFKRTFQTIYSDEFAVFYIYMYIWCYLQETYMVLIIHKTILIRLRTILFFYQGPSWIINYYSLTLSNPHLYDRTGN